MAKQAAKKAAEELLAKVLAEKIKIPEGGDPLQRMGQVLFSTKVNNQFNMEAALEQLREKYGAKKEVLIEELEVPEKPKPAPKKGKKAKDEDDEEEVKPKKKAAPRKKKKEAEDGEEEEAPTPKKRKKKEVDADGEEEEEEESPTKKKKGKIETVCPENEELADLFGEMGRHFFQEKDFKRGAAYQKVYRAIKEHNEVIKSGKQAQKINGIGKSSATKIDEFMATGKIAVLEEIRARADEV